MIIVILLAIAGFVAGYWFWRKQGVARQTQRETRPKQVARYAGVELRTGQRPCTNARELVGKPVLAAEAPMLPLPGCTQETCNCSYRKLGDRRQEEDGRRSSDIGIEPILYSGKESRVELDRRRFF